MSSALVRAAARRSLATVRHVSVVDPDAADGLVADVYAQTDRDFGMLAPPVALHSPSPPLLAASWLLLRESLLATGSADRSAKEAVATAVSQANACPYCVDVHGATLAALGGGLGAEAPLVDWARTSGNRDACGPVPAPDGSAPELLAVSCPQTAVCTAVGDVFSNALQTALVEHYS